MNYFSHFYVLPIYNKPYLCLGSILPDMLRNAKAELAGIEEETNHGSEHFVSLTQGIISHLVVDRKFHNSPFFFENTKLMAHRVRESKEITMNKYTQFYAHILLELLIDYHLIKDNKELVSTFYDHLEKIKLETMEAYFQQRFPSQDFELFWEKLEQFKSRKFLKDYDNLDKVVNFSFYVYEKTTKQKIDRDELSEYTTLIDSVFLPEIQENIRNLFHWLSQEI